MNAREELQREELAVEVRAVAADERRTDEVRANAADGRCADEVRAVAADERRTGEPPIAAASERAPESAASARGEVSSPLGAELSPTDENSALRAAVYARLDALGIPYRRVRHAPAASLDECASVSQRLGAVVCKNYFLTTKSKKHYCLCIVRPEARLRTADISKQVDSPRLTFAGEEELFSMLHERPGSVSPFGLIFDSAAPVRLLMDSALAKLTELAFHPCDNTETLALSTRDFLEKFLPSVGKTPEWVEIHDFMD